MLWCQLSITVNERNLSFMSEMLSRGGAALIDETPRTEGAGFVWEVLNGSRTAGEVIEQAGKSDNTLWNPVTTIKVNSRSQKRSLSPQLSIHSIPFD